MKEKGKLYCRIERPIGIFGGEYKLIILCTETTDANTFKGVIVQNNRVDIKIQTVGWYSEGWNSPIFSLYNEPVILNDQQL